MFLVYLVSSPALLNYNSPVLTYKIEKLAVVSHTIKCSELLWKENILKKEQNDSCQFCPKLHRKTFSSLEYHAKAFGTLFSAISTDCSNDTYNASHNPFLPHSKAKMKQRKCCHPTFSAVIPLHAFHKYTKLASVSDKRFSE